MTLKPRTISEWQELLPRARGVDAVLLDAVANLIEHVPGDMTATVQAGMRLGDFQARLAKAGQWLPLDPPEPEAVTIGGLLANNLSGPRRFGCGMVRDWLIGLAVVLPDGSLIRNGGRVVKNVAGFDLCRLFVAARVTMGFIVEASFRSISRSSDSPGLPHPHHPHAYTPLMTKLSFGRASSLKFYQRV